ncbi:hypothetical protein F1728_15265 [Gimesia benthica]|uniref:Ankyrin repeat domain-containing protein n=1 Tax=Gimesia benthica TaxID=2608982 RepID=A0A6I6AC54_9PLAN|nr:hypothetical protein [Gimesia benthica]QGQ23957.1 hypothetical protein F1728_15265 [Gimesia benthica]
MSFDDLIEAIYARDKYDDFGNLAKTIYTDDPDKFYTDFFDKVRQFVEEGGNINQSRPPMGWSLMHIACEKRDVRLIKGILNIDRSLLNTLADCNYPPIFQALDADIDGPIQTGKEITLETTKAMLELGADSDVKYKTYESLRDFAKSYGKIAVYKFDHTIQPLLQ